MPPMSIAENGPLPPSIGMLFFGTCIRMPLMLPMPVSPIVMYSGSNACTWGSTCFGSTPIMLGRPWPIWFMA